MSPLSHGTSRCLPADITHHATIGHVSPEHTPLLLGGGPSSRARAVSRLTVQYINPRRYQAYTRLRCFPSSGARSLCHVYWCRELWAKLGKAANNRILPCACRRHRPCSWKSTRRGMRSGRSWAVHLLCAVLQGHRFNNMHTVLKYHRIRLLHCFVVNKHSLDRILYFNAVWS